mmetsp:Transcript_20949/g.34549  ORF Transcript_20949/g.34549 Transcript_20949/m.34549 type:complete len:182 (-) Transcript_20949:193-738(-)|eukprot:CAMPEP_0184660018 /NCGR_PEP_ID=MMETSP0308-20130426/32161_1 /TAXON_ID=38269 /ORGANISM="Gloeochaete witrockiana, Strain SAG 46.84" /LENGTH=181 /DNA_ID=CAMNT_0027100325 /DNA_START=69 /DNA_END=614 /DNA_ORIENTATION=-
MPTVYRDVFSGDELISDAFPIRFVENILLEATAKPILIEEEILSASPNASAPHVSRTESRLVLDIVHAFHLHEVKLDSREFATYMRSYIKRVTLYLNNTDPSRTDLLKTGGPAFVRRILADFQDCLFFKGESHDSEGGLVVLCYEADGVTGRMYYLRDGLKPDRRCLSGSSPGTLSRARTI